ncbi:MAG: hypothetical protein LBK06_02585 [Planctomycetaceae bacterium]|jgi:hypothetical protein|nr:hypothetical protein [Planctomycetaceae bacterium]
MNKILISTIIVISSLLNVINFGEGVIFSQGAATVVVSNERSFSIPFQVLNGNGNDQAYEVELLVSNDRGVRWYSVGRKPADSKFFLFEADSDGEYWFSFRTITVAGTVKRSASSSPQVRVIVDTSSLIATQKPIATIDPAQKTRSQQNHNNHSTTTANINTHKPANGVLKPPKPVVFTRELGKFGGKAKDKNKTNTHSNPPTQNEIEFEQLDLSTLDPKDQQPVLADLPFPSSPEEKLLTFNVAANDVKTNDTIATELPDKTNKAERRVKLLLKLIDDFTALFENEIFYEKDKNNVNKNADTKTNTADSEVIVASNAEKILSDTEAKNNRNENNVVAKNEIARESEIAAKVADVPQAAIETGAGAIAKNYNSDNSNHELNRDVGKIRIAGVTMDIETEPYRIIVRWNSENLSAAGSLADVMRGESAAGQWKPIAIGLPNNGEYWWYVSPEDKRPFYLMIRTRNSIDTICEDTTKSAITIPE